MAKLIPFRRPPKPRRKDLVQRASDLAAEGRRLAIYDKETGLFSIWFMELRSAEECYRAVRYGRSLALVVLEVEPNAQAQKVVAALASWLMTERRRSDLPAYLGNGLVAILMPETDVRAADGARARICRFFPGVKAGVGCYPYDGGNFEQLKAYALRQLAGTRAA